MIIEVDFWADFGHFSHPATIYSSLTYPIPPKTAVIGFLAAVGGLHDVREYQFLNNIKYAVKINHLKGKANYSFNGIKDALPSIKGTLQRVKQRKQFYRELLVEPSYKLFIDFSACDERSETIMQNLKEHKSLFQPYMGINLCLANFRYIGEHKAETVTNDTFVPMDSQVPLDIPFEIDTDKNYSDIRIPMFVEEERIFGRFSDFLVELNGKTILAKPQTYTKAGSYNLILS